MAAVGEPSCVSEGLLACPGAVSVHADPSDSLWIIKYDDNDCLCVYYLAVAAESQIWREAHQGVVNGELASPAFHLVYTFGTLGSEAAAVRDAQASDVADTFLVRFSSSERGILAFIFSPGGTTTGVVIIEKLRQGKTWELPIVICEERVPQRIHNAVVIVTGDSSPKGTVPPPHTVPSHIYDNVSLAVSYDVDVSHSEVGAMRLVAPPPDGTVAVSTDEVAVSVVVSGLFRVVGQIATLCFVAHDGLLVSATRQGTIDVWSWDAGADVSEVYGDLCLPVDDCGRTACGAATATVVHGRLWVGTDEGFVVALPFRNTATTALTGAPDSVGQTPYSCHGHEGAVTRIVAVGDGKHLWSCGSRGDSRVNVWDSHSCVLVGSFVFPGGGLSSHTLGPLSWRQSLYGIEGNSGKLAAFCLRGHMSINEAALRLSQNPPRSGSEEQREVKERDSATTGDLHSAMHAVLQFAAHQLEQPQPEAPPHVQKALETVAMTEADSSDCTPMRSLMYLPDALDTLGKGREILCSLHNVEEPGTTRTFLGDLQRAVDDSGELLQLQEEVAAFLTACAAALGLTEIPASLTDVTKALTQLSKGGNGALGSKSLPPSEAPSCLQAKEEEDLSRQLAESQNLLEKREERIEQLERALRLAESAAVVPADEASRAFLLEAQLFRTSQEVDSLKRTVHSLSAAADRADRAEAEAQVLREEVNRFLEKEQIARQAFHHFLRVQNEIADSVASAAQATIDICESDSSVDEPSSSLLYQQLQETIIELDGHIQELLADQREQFSIVRAAFTP